MKEIRFWSGKRIGPWHRCEALMHGVIRHQFVHRVIPAGEVLVGDLAINDCREPGMHELLPVTRIETRVVETQARR